MSELKIFLAFWIILVVNGSPISSEQMLLALYDYEMDSIVYKDSSSRICFIEKNHSFEPNGFLIIPGNISDSQSEYPKGVSKLVIQFCQNFRIHVLRKDINKSHSRNKRNVEGYNSLGSSQSQVQGQVYGQGYFSGQSQSQATGSSQTQIQLGGQGIFGSVSSSAGNSQAQISLAEGSGSGQAGSLGKGPSQSQVQVNLGNYNRGSIASASAGDNYYTRSGHDSNGGRLNGGYQMRHTTASPSNYLMRPGNDYYRLPMSNANLPQLPDMRKISNYDGQQSHERNGYSRDHDRRTAYNPSFGLRTEEIFPPRSTNFHQPIPTLSNLWHQTSSTSRVYPTIATTPSGTNRDDIHHGQNRYSGHATSSNNDFGQPQTVHLGRGSTDFYNPSSIIQHPSSSSLYEPIQGHINYNGQRVASQYAPKQEQDKRFQYPQTQSPPQSHWTQQEKIDSAAQRNSEVQYTNYNGYPKVRNYDTSANNNQFPSKIEYPFQFRQSTQPTRTSHYDTQLSLSGGQPQLYSTTSRNGNNKKCTIMTFTCTLLVESNGRAKICRPNGQYENSASRLNLDYGKSAQICCC